jgi:hypothetical protein
MAAIIGGKDPAENREQLKISSSFYKEEATGHFPTT